MTSSRIRPWIRRPGVGGTVPVRFPSGECPGEVGYHIEGNWWEVRSTGQTCGPAAGPARLVPVLRYQRRRCPHQAIAGSHLFVPPVLAPAGETGMAGEMCPPAAPVGAVPACREATARRAMCTCATHSSFTPRPGRTGAPAPDDGPARHRGAGRLHSRRIRPLANSSGKNQGPGTDHLIPGCSRPPAGLRSTDR